MKKIIALVIMSLLVIGLFSCADFEKQTFEMSNYDNAVTLGLLDNGLTTLADQLAAVDILSINAIWTEAMLDSLMGDATGRAAIVNALEADTIVFIPGNKRVLLQIPVAAMKGLFELDMTNQTAGTWTFYFSHFLTLSVWKVTNGQLLKIDDRCPLEVIAASNTAKTRQSMTLEKAKYVVSVNKSEGAKTVATFIMTCFPENYQVSDEIQAVCGALGGKISTTGQLKSMVQMDSTWTGKTVAQVVALGELTNLLNRLNSVTYANIDRHINLVFPVDQTEGLIKLDLRSAPAVEATNTFYFNDFVNLTVYDATDSLNVTDAGRGVTFDETSGCLIRQKISFDLINHIYIIRFTRFAQVAPFASFGMVFTR